jgi:hypothetical protein
MSTSPRRQPALGTLRILVPTLLAVLVAGLTTIVLGATQPSVAQAAKPQRHHHAHLAIAVLPSVRHPGAAAASSSAASSVVAVTLRPRKAGRVVKLQRQFGLTWRTLAVKRLHRGKASFPVATDPSAVYRATVPAHGRTRVVHSRHVSNNWGTPDFVDEFDGAALGPAWEHRIQFYNPWGGRACSKGSPDAVSVADGVLRLSSMPDPLAHGRCLVRDTHQRPLGRFPYRLNGHVSTEHSADFLYGFAAARMRFPRILGQHAAFWMQPRGLLDFGTTPWGAEIDVVEWYGAGRGKQRMASAVHAPMPDGSKRQIGGQIPDPGRYLATRSDTWWHNFHVFSLQWTPQRYVFRIDGHEVWRTRDGVSHVHEFLILSMLSSDFELPDVGDDPTPRTAEVDWAAFWQAS